MKDDFENRCKELEYEKAALQKENELYLTILDSVCESVYAIDEEDKIILFNKRVEEVEGYQRSDILGRDEKEVYCYDPEPYYTFVTEKIKKTHKPILKKAYTYHMKNGRSIPLVSDCYPFFYNNTYAGMYTISQTITQSRDIMERIQDNQALLSKANRQNPLAETRYSLDHIVGKSAKFKEVVKLAKRVALRDSTVMIIGETGTGKELFAQGIHRASPQHRGDFVPINCAAIPDNLLESILFGTVKGAFTGAVDSLGIFEQAENGTVFLDEIDSMPLTLQAKLLRAIQEKKIRRLGSQKEVDINCRIISATNVSIQKMDGIFRSDLLFRLSVITLHLPPLKERQEDIIPLAQHFVDHFNKKFKTGVLHIDEELQRILYIYQWPGNVRELENIIESAMNFLEENEETLTFDHFPDYYQEKLLNSALHNHPLTNQPSKAPLREAMKNFEKHYILSALEKNNWNITHAAEQLGMKRQNLHAKVKEYEFEKPL